MTSTENGRKEYGQTVYLLLYYFGTLKFLKQSMSGVVTNEYASMVGLCRIQGGRRMIVTGKDYRELQELLDNCSNGEFMYILQLLRTFAEEEK